MRWLFAILISFSATGAWADGVDRDAICTELAQDYVEKHQKSRDYRLYRIFDFYSSKIDACIHVEAKLFGTSVQVRDLTGVVFKGHENLLLDCDARGIDDVSIETVRVHRGDVEELPVKDWMSDGLGGPARTVKTAEIPLTRRDCEAALERWLVRWNG
ncbi:hypothetical protein [Parasedimentitalea huanghaiensis]|uniref:Uncharacterized protein n=1 Tax=Parasedimentitalea huanghaiensis TaxID=2682100 RepID=A0A6L6WCN9_9RHOB|nr:hypothetical protein [Zongyanglinia huanghaiensis]MVO14998.1 hypothetical protein [Zongyanglinia huanghaiensis]